MATAVTATLEDGQLQCALHVMLTLHEVQAAARLQLLLLTHQGRRSHLSHGAATLSKP